MMPFKKIITASAGTGKTYRLSLEFLGLLYNSRQYPEFKIDHILVITFTKKATAEIRERIYSQLEQLGKREGNWKELAKNLQEQVLNIKAEDADNPLSEEDSNFFLTKWQYLVTHRDELQVMTIDSYIHSIFRNLVRPARGIDRFTIDTNATLHRIPLLFAQLMTPAFIDKVNSLLQRKMKPALEEFNEFFTGLIENRWLHFLTEHSEETIAEASLAAYSKKEAVWEKEADEYWQKFIKNFKELLNDFTAFVDQNGILKEGKEYKDLFLKEFLDALKTLPNDINEIPALIDSNQKNSQFKEKLFISFVGSDHFWNGTKFRKNSYESTINNWKQRYQEVRQQLADHMIFANFLPEQKEILDLWKIVLSEYDKLVFRSKDFTYDDVTWLTFEALHSSYPPLFIAETDSQPNEFYEFISHRTRFILIDEFQDTSILQFRIFQPIIEELLSGIGVLPYGGLIVVGDEKQSIFGWRGGQRDLLLNLEYMVQPHMDTEKASLTKSWRSTDHLIQIINGIFGHEILQNHLSELDLKWIYEKEINGMNNDKDTPSWFKFRLQNLSLSDRSGGWARNLKEFIYKMVVPFCSDKNHPKGSIAVLCRTNKELEKARYLLNEAGIPCEYQSNFSLLDQPVIKAMMFLLRFAVFNDWYDFLAFLRSDIILLDAEPLRKVISAISAFEHKETKDQSEPDFSAVPEAQAAWKLALELDASYVYRNCLRIIQTCNLQERIKEQRDFVNLQKFLDVTKEYESRPQSEIGGLIGFLRYCEKNREQDFMLQEDVQSADAVQLLTFHSSKGLEFDTVFIWWNLQPPQGEKTNNLHSWVQYADTGFSSYKNYAFTLNSEKTLKHSSFNSIMREDDMRSELEELNILYVGMTRARFRLGLNAAFTKKDGWENYWNDKNEKDKLTLPHYAIKAALDFVSEKTIPDEDLIYSLSDTTEPQKEEVATKKELPETITCIDTMDIKSVLSNPLLPKTLIPLTPTESERNWKQSFLHDRDNLKGNIVHYYLAQLQYAELEELKQARILTLRQFGNLLPKSELEAIIDKVENQLYEIKDIFNPRYDLVFTEFPVYENGKEYRLDRLLLNTKDKTYRIVDYKTGEVYDNQQLERYNRIVKEHLLPADYRMEQELMPTYIKL